MAILISKSHSAWRQSWTEKLHCQKRELIPNCSAINFFDSVSNTINTVWQNHSWGVMDILFWYLSLVYAFGQDIAKRRNKNTPFPNLKSFPSPQLPYYALHSIHISAPLISIKLLDLIVLLFSLDLMFLLSFLTLAITQKMQKAVVPFWISRPLHMQFPKLGTMSQ